ncbi:MAG: phenylacetate--CoA ligase family protein [Candidatus Bathyarchaeales archaeon]
MVKHSYEHVPFYHRKFRAAGVKPEDIRSLEDLRKIPVTTKFELQACAPNDLIASGVDVASLVKRTTSGSTGVPLTIFLDNRVEDFYAAVWLRAMYQAGLRVLDKMAIIADPRSFPRGRSAFQRLGLAERKYISIFDSAERQMTSLQDFKPDIVKGYASNLHILAAEFGNSLHKLGARLVFSGAELLDAVSRRRISSAFGCEVFDFYGSSEFSLLAWECKEHNGYHINADSVLMELLDDEGKAVASGERGKVVCTGLFNSIMPLIRYSLDDIAVPISGECSCGIALPLVQVVEGRADDFLVASDGRLISPTVFFPFPFDDVEWIRQFRIVQESKCKLVVQVVAKDVAVDQSRVIELAGRRLRELFGEDMNIEFKFLATLPRDRSGKVRKVISYAPVKFCNS